MPFLGNLASKLNHSILFILICCAVSHGQDVNLNAVPIDEVFPVTSGIIFPSFLTAAGVNPAALPQKGKGGSVLGLDYSPAPGGDGAHQYSLGVASGDSRVGGGIGYRGTFQKSATHALFAGAGFRSESTSIGVSLRMPDLSKGFSPQTDLGILTSTKSDVTFGLVMYHLESSPQIDVGLGFGKDKNYEFEINILLPAVGSLFQANSEFVLTAATTVYASIFGLSFNSSYNTHTSEVSQSVSLLIWFFKNCGVTLQYRSPNRSYYGLIIPL